MGSPSDLLTFVAARFLSADKMLDVITQQGFRVKNLAARFGVDVRTLERRFREQFHTTPKTWIIQQRMNMAPTLLAQGLSNKEVAAALNYSCQSNFCREFKRSYGRPPQEFARILRSQRQLSRFDT